MKKMTPKIALSALLCSSLLLSACNQEASEEAAIEPAKAAETPMPSQEAAKEDTLRLDEHSYGNMHQVKLTHLDLDLDVNFEAKSMAGTADLSFERIDPKVSQS